MVACHVRVTAREAELLVESCQVMVLRVAPDSQDAKLLRELRARFDAVVEQLTRRPHD